MKTLLLAAAGCLGASLASAQTHQPYAGLEARPVKSLSEQQLADLRAGRGMGLALAAELNGYPGPAHVLELADQLGLSTEQKARVGELFAGHSATPASVAAATAEIGETQAKLRAAHLRYHLSTLEVQPPPQVQRCTELRGY